MEFDEKGMWIESVEEWADLVKNSNVGIRCKAAASPVIPKEAQFILLRDESEWVRLSLAGNVAICQEVQERLAYDRKYTVREKLAHNPGLSEKVQMWAASDPSTRVQRSLADNPSLKLKPAIKLYLDRFQGTREYFIKKQPRLSRKIEKMINGLATTVEPEDANHSF